jgi:hypothetical protein
MQGSGVVNLAAATINRAPCAALTRNMRPVMFTIMLKRGKVNDRWSIDAGWLDTGQLLRSMSRRVLLCPSRKSVLGTDELLRESPMGQLACV